MNHASTVTLTTHVHAVTPTTTNITLSTLFSTYLDHLHNHLFLQIISVAVHLSWSSSSLFILMTIFMTIYRYFYLHFLFLSFSFVSFPFLFFSFLSFYLQGGATFLTVDASTIENKWLGESEKNAKAVFTLARWVMINRKYMNRY